MHAVVGASLLYHRQQIVGRGIALLVLQQVVSHLAVCRHNLAYAPCCRLLLLMHRRCGNKSLNVPLVRVCQEAHHRHCVVGFVLNVRKHYHAGLACIAFICREKPQRLKHGHDNKQ